jgi:uncharacterized membrane protein
MREHSDFLVELFPGPGLGVKLKRIRIRDVMNGISFRAGRVPFRIIALLLPVLLVLVHLVVMYATLRYDQFLIVVGLIIAYILPPAGKETVIPLGIAVGIPWWYIATAIAMVDVETGLFMALNFDLVYHIPWLGGILTRFTDKTTLFLKDHRWVAGFSVISIVLMVMVPLLGSGGIRGSIAGKLLGIEEYLVFLAIVAGAFIGCFAIALGSNVIIGLLCLQGIIPGDIFGICNRM